MEKNYHAKVDYLSSLNVSSIEDVKENIRNKFESEHWLTCEQIKGFFGRLRKVIRIKHSNDREEALREQLKQAIQNQNRIDIST